MILQLGNNCNIALNKTMLPLSLHSLGNFEYHGRSRTRISERELNPVVNFWSRSLKGCAPRNYRLFGFLKYQDLRFRTYVLLKQKVWWVQPFRLRTRRYIISCLLVAAPQKPQPVWFLNYQNLWFKAHLIFRTHKYLYLMDFLKRA